MKEITIISGKGGTGKTSITAAFAALASSSVFCDNDVDAANLHLILQPEIVESHIYEGAYIAEINQESCTQCGICYAHCRFAAINIKQEKGEYSVNTVRCEGCRLCERVCPENAIVSERSKNNQWYISNTRFGTLVHAHMGPGEENSGKLVSKLRHTAREIAKKQHSNWIINDGPPGIGCAAISSITGADLIILVTEPTKSGLHDLQRVTTLIQNFKIPGFAIINKYDLQKEVAVKAENYLNNRGIEVIAKIPFSKLMVDATVSGNSMIEHAPESDISKLITRAWQKISVLQKKD